MLSSILMEEPPCLHGYKNPGDNLNLPPAKRRKLRGQDHHHEADDEMMTLDDDCCAVPMDYITVDEDKQQHDALCEFLQALYHLRSGVVEVRDIMKRCIQEGFILTDRARMEIRLFVASYWD